MNTEQFIDSLHIEEARLYSYGEIATMMDKEVRTVRGWCAYGVKTKTHGVQFLGKFNSGRTVVIPGKCLIDFILKTQNCD